MPIHRAMAPLWIIAISLVVIVLWVIGVPAILVTALRTSTPPAITVTPTPDPEAWTPKWEHVCEGLTPGTYHPDYREWLRNWGDYEGHTLYFVGRMVRPHPDQADTFYVDVVLDGAYSTATGRGIVVMEKLQLPAGKLLLPDSQIEVAGLAQAPVIDRGTGAHLPQLRVVVWRDLTAARRGCRSVKVWRTAKGQTEFTPKIEYRWEN